MAVKLKSHCPNCKRSLNVDETLVGRSVKCPNCEHRWELSSVKFQSPDSIVPSMEATRSGDQNTTELDSLKSTSSIGAEEPTIGIVDRFELKQVLGHGGFGKVYRAYDPILSRQVAIKLPKFGSDEKRKIRRFLTEAKSAASLRHPNIVAVFESGKTKKSYYIASEYVKGRTLSQLCKEQQPDFNWSVRCVRDLAHALEYAHEEGIIHRDIKPDNIMIDTHDRPQIMDFGLAKRLDEDSSMTTDGLLGTPAYMSPEQARGDLGEVGPKSDQYSLGVVLYELLAGKRPFDGPPHSVIVQITQEEPPALQIHNPEIPRDLRAICQKSMEKEPNRRFESLNEMAEDLDRWLSGRETLARPLKPRERLIRWGRRNPMVSLLTLCICLLITIMLAGSLYATGRISLALLQVGKEKERADENAQQAQKDKLLAEKAKDKAEEERGRAEKLATERQTLLNDKEQQRKRALQHQKQAEEARKIADEARRKVENRLAEIQFDRGMRLCEQGDMRQGLLWFVRSLKNCSDTDPALAQDIRQIVAGWYPLLREVKWTVRHKDVIWDSSFSPNGKQIVTCSGDGTAQIWNAETGDPIGARLQHGQRVQAAAFSPSGDLLATGAWGGAVRLWNAQTGEQIGEPIMQSNSHTNVSSLIFSRDGKLLLTGCHDNKIRVINVQSRTIMPDKELTGIDMAISPDWKTIATTSYAGDPVKLFDLTTGKQKNVALDHQEIVFDITFSPDGKLLATASDQGEVRVWDIQSGKLKHMVEPNRARGNIRDIQFSHDGRFLITSGQNAEIWSTKSFEQTRIPITFRGGITSMALSTDDSRIFLGGGTGIGTLIDAPFKEQSAKLVPEMKDWTWMILDETQGEIVGSTGGLENEIRWLDNKSLQETRPALRVDGLAPNEGIVAVVNESTLLIRSNDTTLHLVDSQSGQKIGNPMNHRGLVYNAWVSRDRKMVVTGTRNFLLHIWDARNGQQLREPIRHDYSVWAVSFDSTGKRLLVVTKRRFFYQWDVETWTELTPHKQLQQSVNYGVQFSKNGKLLAWPFDNNYVRLWDVESELSSVTILEHQNLSTISISQDATLIATGSLNGEVRICNCATGRPLTPPLQNGWPVEFVTILPDNQQIIATSRGQTPRLWTIAPAVKGDPEVISLWISSITGEELGEHDVVRVLSHEEHLERKQQLKQMGGFNVP